MRQHLFTRSGDQDLTSPPQAFHHPATMDFSSPGTRGPVHSRCLNVCQGRCEQGDTRGLFWAGLCIALWSRPVASLPQVHGDGAIGSHGLQASRPFPFLSSSQSQWACLAFIIRRKSTVRTFRCLQPEELARAVPVPLTRVRSLLTRPVRPSGVAPWPGSSWDLTDCSQVWSTFQKYQPAPLSSLSQTCQSKPQALGVALC